MPIQSPLSKKQLFLFDLDGVLSVGKDRPRLVGGVRLVSRLRLLNRKVVVLTNSSTDSREGILMNLQSMGFNFSLDEILSASYLTSQYLKEKYGTVDCFLIGEEGFRRELEEFGHTVKDSDADFVVVGIDRLLTYDKLNIGVQLLRRRAKLVACHMSRLYMSAHGPALGVGPIAKALEYGSGKRAVSIGKPSPLMFKLAMKRAGASVNETVMIGDQIDTDVTGAKKLGIFSILPLTGVENLDTISRSEIKPDMVVKNVDDIVEML